MAGRASSNVYADPTKSGIASDVATFLVDTSVLVDHLNDKRGRTSQLVRLLTQGHGLASCPVTVAEVYAGMRPDEAHTTDLLLGSLEFYETTWEVARSAGRLKYDWALKGVALSIADTLIAATAIHYELPLITDNRKHFPMPELVLHELGDPATD